MSNIFISPEIEKIQPTYIIFERKNEINIQPPQKYSIDISTDDEKKIEEIWLKKTDTVIEIKKGREFKVNEKLFMVQRYLHNELNISYKNVIDVEIIYSENSMVHSNLHTESNSEDLRILHRYPNERRNAIDFQETLLDTFVDCGLLSQNIINGYKRMYVMVMVSSERQIIGELVNRYLFIESCESQVSIYEPEAPYIQPTGLIEPSNINPYQSIQSIQLLTNNNLNSSTGISNNNHQTFIESPEINNNWGNIFNFSSLSGQTGSYSNMFQEFPSISVEQKTNYETKIQELETQRENELNEIRQMFHNDQNPRVEIPSSMELGNNIIPVSNNVLENGDVEIIYAINAVNSVGSTSPTRQTRNNHLFGNFISLLQYVNNINIVNDVNDVNFENLLEPVRVTINEENLDIFLTSFKYGDIEEELKIKDQSTCSICLSDFEKNENVSYLNYCNHLFHTNCINKWLQEFNHKCPNCRKSADPSKNF